MENWDGMDKRQFPRIKYPCLVVIRNGNDDEDKNNTVLTHTENVGVGGVCVSLKQSVKIFSVVEIELDLLDLGDHIRCKGKVVWNIENENTGKKSSRIFDVGIEFIDIMNEDQTRLQEVLERLAKKNA
jgi:Tfp pilus assembly protein PilZ